MARVSLAVQMGRATRVLSGWAPTYKIDGDTITASPEFDAREVEILLAWEEIQRDVCPGCNGFLSETTVADHGYRIHEKVCQRCRSIDIYHTRQDKNHEHTEGTELESPRSARRLWLEKIALPDDLDEPETDGA